MDTRGKKIHRAPSPRTRLLRLVQMKKRKKVERLRGRMIRDLSRAIGCEEKGQQPAWNQGTNGHACLSASIREGFRRDGREESHPLIASKESDSFFKRKERGLITKELCSRVAKLIGFYERDREVCTSSEWNDIFYRILVRIDRGLKGRTGMMACVEGPCARSGLNRQE